MPDEKKQVCSKVRNSAIQATNAALWISNFPKSIANTGGKEGGKGASAEGGEEGRNRRRAAGGGGEEAGEELEFHVLIHVPPIRESLNKKTKGKAISGGGPSHKCGPRVSSFHGTIYNGFSASSFLGSVIFAGDCIFCHPWYCTLGSSQPAQRAYGKVRERAKVAMEPAMRVCTVAFGSHERFSGVN